MPDGVPVFFIRRLIYCALSRDAAAGGFMGLDVLNTL